MNECYAVATSFREGISLIGSVLVSGGIMSIIIKRYFTKIDKIEDIINKLIPIIPLIKFIESKLNEKVDGIKQDLDKFQGRMERNIEKLEDKVESLIKKE